MTPAPQTATCWMSRRRGNAGIVLAFTFAEKNNVIVREINIVGFAVFLRRRRLKPTLLKPNKLASASACKKSRTPQVSSRNSESENTPSLSTRQLSAGPPDQPPHAPAPPAPRAHPRPPARKIRSASSAHLAETTAGRNLRAKARQQVSSTNPAQPHPAAE